MLEFNKLSKTFEQEEYRFQLQDVEKTDLYIDIFFMDRQKDTSRT